MNKFLTIICIPFLGVSLALATGEKIASPAPGKTQSTDQTSAGETKNKPPAESSGITVKNKSSFDLAVGTRNPFWPIGFKPRARIGGSGDSDGEVPPSAFLVSTITLDTATHFAIINGKTMFEGQQFGLQIGGQIYQVTVKRIEDGRVILGRHDEEIVVPLRRK
jgi:hypothetical protein